MEVQQKQQHYHKQTLPPEGPHSSHTLHMVCLMAEPESQLGTLAARDKGNTVLTFAGTALQWNRCLYEEAILEQAPD